VIGAIIEIGRTALEEVVYSVNLAVPRPRR
jgi:hypothetical protein